MWSVSPLALDCGSNSAPSRHAKVLGHFMLARQLSRGRISMAMTKQPG